MASKTYVSAVPLAMVRLAGGGYQSVLEGDPIAAEAVEPDDLKRMVRKGYLREAKAEDVKATSSAAKKD